MKVEGWMLDAVAKLEESIVAKREVPVGAFPFACLGDG